MLGLNHVLGACFNRETCSCEELFLGDAQETSLKSACATYMRVVLQQFIVALRYLHESGALHYIGSSFSDIWRFIRTTKAFYSDSFKGKINQVDVKILKNV